jgi:formylglycine-generating enzyme required for sulfatase activity
MRVLLYVVLVFVGTSFALADPPAGDRSAAWHKQLADQFDKGNKWAVIIGIDKYTTQAPLHACVNDTKLLSETLARNCGYDKSRITVLTDEQATKLNIQKTLSEVLKKVGRNDIVFISFAGHGMCVDGQSFFCPVDDDPANGKLSGVRCDEIRTMLNDCKAAQKIMVIDCCESGTANKTGSPRPSSQEVAGGFQNANGLITLAGCRRDQESNEINGHGIFTAQFAKGLAGEADFDKNGIVDSDELYRHLILEVPAAAKLIRPDHAQTPVRIIGDDVVGVFAMSRPDGRGPPVVVQVPTRPKAGDTITNALGMKLAYLVPGPVTVGSPRTEYLRNDDEPQQPLMISLTIYLGTTEVTQAQYTKLMGKNPSYYCATGDGADAVTGKDTSNFPVEQVSWNDATSFCVKLSALPEEMKAKRAYRLPTEAEWEYACRGGTASVFHTGDRISPKQANIRGDRPYLNSPEGESLGRTGTVGSYQANDFGLYDMHGNVAEWCQDFYTPKRFLSMAPGSTLESHDSWKAFTNLIDSLSVADRKRLALLQDPTGPGTGETRVYRGGAFTGDVNFCRSACRRDKDPGYTYRGIGFRVVCYPLITK